MKYLISILTILLLLLSNFTNVSSLSVSRCNKNENAFVKECSLTINKRLHESFSAEFPSIQLSKDGLLEKYRNPRTLNYFDVEIFGKIINPVKVISSALNKIKYDGNKKPIIALRGSSVYFLPEYGSDFDIHLINLEGIKDKDKFRFELKENIKEVLEKYFPSQNGFIIETFFDPRWSHQKCAFNYYFKVKKNSQISKVYFFEMILADWRNFRGSQKEQSNNLVLANYYNLSCVPVIDVKKIKQRKVFKDEYIDVLNKYYKSIYWQANNLFKMLIDIDKYLERREGKDRAKKFFLDKLLKNGKWKDFETYFNNATIFNENVKKNTLESNIKNKLKNKILKKICELTQCIGNEEIFKLAGKAIILESIDNVKIKQLLDNLNLGKNDNKEILSKRFIGNIYNYVVKLLIKNCKFWEKFQNLNSNTPIIETIRYPKTNKIITYSPNEKQTVLGYITCAKPSGRDLIVIGDPHAEIHQVLYPLISKKIVKFNSKRLWIPFDAEKLERVENEHDSRLFEGNQNIEMIPNLDIIGDDSKLGVILLGDMFDHGGYFGSKLFYLLVDLVQRAQRTKKPGKKNLFHVLLGNHEAFILTGAELPYTNNDLIFRGMKFRNIFNALKKMTALELMKFSYSENGILFLHSFIVSNFLEKALEKYNSSKVLKYFLGKKVDFTSLEYQENLEELSVLLNKDYRKAVKICSSQLKANDIENYIQKFNQSLFILASLHKRKVLDLDEKQALEYAREFIAKGSSIAFIKKKSIEKISIKDLMPYIKFFLEAREFEKLILKTYEISVKDYIFHEEVKVREELYVKRRKYKDLWKKTIWITEGDRLESPFSIFPCMAEPNLNMQSASGHATNDSGFEKNAKIRAIVFPYPGQKSRSETNSNGIAYSNIIGCDCEALFCEETRDDNSSNPQYVFISDKGQVTINKIREDLRIDLFLNGIGAIDA